MGGVASSARISRTMISNGGSKLKFDPLPEKGGDRADPRGQVEQDFAVTVPHTALQGADLS